MQKRVSFTRSCASMNFEDLATVHISHFDIHQLKTTFQRGRDLIGEYGLPNDTELSVMDASLVSGLGLVELAP